MDSEAIKIINVGESIKKTRKPRRTKAQMLEGQSEEPLPNIPEEEDSNEAEREKLQRELLSLAEINPDVVSKPVSTELSSKINEMSIEELKARISQGRRVVSKKLDNSVADQFLTLTNSVAGNLLGCYEELQESTQQDELLKESTRDFLSFNLLNLIPLEVKLGGLYSSHIVSAKYKAGKKEQQAPPQQKESIIVNEEPEDKPVEE